jgi:hypothetical protein
MAKETWKIEFTVTMDDPAGPMWLANDIARTVATHFHKDPDWEGPENIRWTEVEDAEAYDPTEVTKEKRDARFKAVMDKIRSEQRKRGVYFGEIE